MAEKLIARWETRGKKYWYDLYSEPFKGKSSHHYRMKNGGGNIGYSTKAEAIAYILKRMKYDDNNYKRVK